MIVQIILLALITWFTSPIALAEGYRVMITEDGQYFDEIKVPNNKYTGIINQSGRQLDAHKLKLIIDEKGSITTEAKYDFSWENPIRIKSVETITEVIRLENNVIRKVSVNEIGAPKIKSNYFFIFASGFIVLTGLAIIMFGSKLFADVGVDVSVGACAVVAITGAAVAAGVSAAAVGAGDIAGVAAGAAGCAAVVAVAVAASVDARSNHAVAFSKFAWLAIALMLVSMISFFI